MRVVTIVSEVRIIGYGWYGQKIAMVDRLSSQELKQILDYCGGKYSREGVEQWLSLHSGDFQNIVDFAITIGDNEFDSDWTDEESEYSSFFDEYELENN